MWQNQPIAIRQQDHLHILDFPINEGVGNLRVYESKSRRESEIKKFESVKFQTIGFLKWGINDKYG